MKITRNNETITEAPLIMSSPLQKGFLLLFISFLLLITSNVFAQNKPNESNLLSDKEVTAIVNRHFEVLNIQDSIVRLEEMGKIYTPNLHIADTYFEYFNYKNFNHSVSQIHSRYPESEFSVTDLTIIPNVARASWKLGNDLIGQNFFIFEKGKIKEILAFVSPVKVNLDSNVNPKFKKIIEKHFETLNIQNAAKRLKLMGDIYTKDFHIVDTYFEYFKYKDFNSAVDLIHLKFPGSLFSVTETRTIPNVAESTWKLGGSLIGQNVFIFKNGKVKTILAFVQTLAK